MDYRLITVGKVDVESERRRCVRDAQKEQRWREESDDDPVVFARRYLDRLVGRVGAESPEEAAEIVVTSVGDDADRAQLERVGELAEWIVGLAEMVAKLEARRSDVEAGIVRKCGPPKIRVRNMAKLLPESPRPKLDPAAPKAERAGRRGEAPLVQPGAPEADAVWLRGQVLTWNRRTWLGSVRVSDGREIPLAVGVLVRSGLTTLVVGMKCECRVIAGECELDQGGLALRRRLFRP
jgi:hypothetical protein